MEIQYGHRLILVVLKAVHTFIWIVMTTANFTAFYLALVGRFNWIFFLCLALLGGEILIIVLNRRRCPLTDVMAKYTTDRASNFDIYRPEWLARNNIRIFSILMAVEVIVVLLRRLVHRA